MTTRLYISNSVVRGPSFSTSSSALAISQLSLDGSCYTFQITNDVEQHSRDVLVIFLVVGLGVIVCVF